MDVSRPIGGSGNPMDGSGSPIDGEGFWGGVCCPVASAGNVTTITAAST
jgi:hypothetical protein